MAYTPQNPSQKTLERTLERGWKFMGTLSRGPEIVNQLLARGFSQQEFSKGWALLLAGAGYQPPTPQDDTPPPPNPGREASAELDNWDEPNFDIAEATLIGEFPEQYNFIFGRGLTPKKGPASVGSITTFLDALDNLESDPKNARPNTREADRAAIAALAAVGIHADERKRIRGLLEITTTTFPAAPAPAPLPDEAERQKALLAYYFWFKKWSTIARRTITRNDYLIRLTLKTIRKTPGGDEITDTPDDENEGSD